MLVPCPLKDQRSEKGADGRPPEDGNMDCVATALASMAQALTGRVLTGDGLHDAVYGEGYIGLQDPARYVALLASLGLTLTPYTGTPAALIAHAVACILAGHPVLLSIPSDWGDEPPHSPYAHMVAGCDLSDAGSLTAMNPWGGFYQTQSRAWWQERLATCAYKATWVMTRTGGSMVPNGWHDDGTTLTAPNGEQTAGWIRQHVIDAVPQWPDDLMPVAPLYGIAGGWRQDFVASRSVSASTAGATDEHPGLDYRAQIAALNAEIAHLKAAGTSDPTAAQLRTALDAFLKA